MTALVYCADEAQAPWGEQKTTELSRQFSVQRDDERGPDDPDDEYINAGSLSDSDIQAESAKMRVRYLSTIFTALKRKKEVKKANFLQRKLSILKN